MPKLLAPRKVSYSPDEVETFNERYCGRKLPVAPYWFEMTIKKVGGITFLKIGRITIMWCVSKPRNLGAL